MPRIFITSRAGTATAIALAMLAFQNQVHAGTLREALAQAYNANPTLTGARARQRTIDEQVPIEKADGRPNAGATAQYSEQIDRALPQVTARRSAQGSATVNVPIYSGGAVRNAINAAKLRVEAGQNDLRGTEASIFSAVVAAYMDVIRDTSIVELNAQNVHALEVNFQASSDRFEVGDITRTDVAQSAARLALARADLQRAQAQLIGSKENYIALVGSAPDALEPPPPLPGLPDAAETAVSIALTDNPDIQAAEKSRLAASYDVKVAKAQVMPRISAFAQGSHIDYLNTEPSAGGVPSTTQATVGASISLPLYQGGRPAALARQNVARESLAIEQQIATERSIIAQTRSAFASYRASLEAIESTRTAVDSSALSLEGVKAENGVGSRTILDILNAEQEALNARVQLVTAQRNAYVAGFTLLAAMGHAEARDLNLDGAQLYDPTLNYGRVKNKLMDFDFDPAPKAQATRTNTTPTQTAPLPPLPPVLTRARRTVP